MTRLNFDFSTSLHCVSLSAGCQRHSPQNTDLPITAEHYARAEKWLKENALARVKSLFVMPSWIEGEDHPFWYQRETAQRYDFTVVNAASSEKSSAFDHEALAAELRRLGEQTIDSLKLPLSDLVFAEKRSRMGFSAQERRYRCRLAPLTRECQREVTPEGVLVSPDGRWGIKTENANIVLVDLKQGTQRPLTHYGQPHFSYGLYHGNWSASYIPNERAGNPFVPPWRHNGALSSQYVLVSRLNERQAAEYPFMESTPADGSFRPKVHMPRTPLTGEEPTKLEWFIINVPSGRKVRLNLPYEKLLYLQ